jgi:hypothetical protein
LVIENKPDREATKAARKAREIHSPSWISYAGHVYLESALDKKALRDQVMRQAKYICALCGEYCPSWDGDLDHIKSGRPVVRCWCFFRPLPDGTICTNARWVHSMFSVKPCHRNRHNREVKWRSQSNDSKA